MLDNKLRYYIAGPMTGYPQFNIPLFDEVALAMRRQGLDVTSPTELDSEGMRALAMQSTDGNMVELESEGTWGDCLARDVKLLADELDAIVLLPQWYDSRGANLEAFVGLLCAKQFFLWNAPSKAIVPMSPRWVSDLIRESMHIRHGTLE